MPKLQFLTMSGCHNCAKVKKTIEEIKLDFPSLEIEEVDITTPKGQEMVQKYSIMSSPGIIIDGELFSTGGVNKENLIKKLKGE
ncbi:MAG TPA: thioredoxin family protein [Candidatus Nealsonbacteria bacterium]|uniref:Thioredoxin-like fold domain-containing protein n=1 Tax=marine sediment metagenome TaxID=412755 RepID=A0A0F9UPE6_9ZZZZ|nr:thioredoxin family protein [Candidatus Nealsonbacteria bacterium]HEB46726.1 thioredoxin family protein [Candidatus Nealsonbacteria bacterium]